MPLPVEAPQLFPRATKKNIAPLQSRRNNLILQKDLNGRHVRWADSNPTVATVIMKCLAMLFMPVIMLAPGRASDAAVRIVLGPAGRIGAYDGKYKGLRSSREIR